MAKEKVKIIDPQTGEEDKEIEIKCRFLLPREAEKMVEEVVDITELKPVTVEVDGKTKESHTLKGNFSGMIGLKRRALDKIIINCAEAKQISSEDRNEIYKKYGEKTLQQVMTDLEVINPK